MSMKYAVKKAEFVKTTMFWFISAKKNAMSGMEIIAIR